MICLRCDNENDFGNEKRLVEQLFRGKTLMVPNEVSVCKKCGWFTVDCKQADSLLKNTLELYKNIYGDKEP